MGQRGNPNWKKGVSGNPKGGPRKPEVQELREALEQVKKKKNKSFLVHFVERAYDDDNCAIALAKKILPDKIEDESLKNAVRTFLIRADANLQAKFDQNQKEGNDTGA